MVDGERTRTKPGEEGSGAFIGNDMSRARDDAEFSEGGVDLDARLHDINS